jgi:hypothetical protein
MHPIGLIEVENARGGLSLARWKEFASTRPQLAQGPAGGEINELYFQHPHRWKILDGDTCIGSLTWRRDHPGSDGAGYVVVASAEPESEAVFTVGWSLADLLDGEYHPCSARFLEITETVSRLEEQLVEIHFNDGRVFLAEIAYCGFGKNEERVYFFRLDPETLQGEEGLYSVRLAKISAIVPSAIPPPRRDSPQE